jgi:hypothetical protein
MPQSRFINAVASTTFGVLLIHAAPDGMRKWLWQDLVDVPMAYSLSLPLLVGYSIAVMFGVFAVCSAIDYMRIKFVERPVFKLLKLDRDNLSKHDSVSDVPKENFGRG